MTDWRNPYSGTIKAGAQSMNKPFLSKAAKGSILWGAVSVPMNLANGDDFGTAALRAGAETALWYTAPGIMMTHMAATGLPQLGAAIKNTHKQKVNEWNLQHMLGTIGGNYMDTQRALTMRQAAVQQIQGSKLNAHSALGGEARILAQSWYK